MPSLESKYLGLSLSSPILVAASSISSRPESVQRAEEAGAGGLVVRSLFEEQIAIDREQFEAERTVGADAFAEATDYFPAIPHGDAAAHLRNIEKLRKSVKMPLIASLNAVEPGSWTAYAKQLEDTGVDAIELNVYAVATQPDRTSREIESDLYETADRVVRAVKIPVGVKLCPYYTALAHVVSQLQANGVRGVVLFNRFLQPDIDADREELRIDMPLSHRDEMRLPLRWTGILHGRVNLDLCLNTGVQTGLDVVRAILAGANAVQVAGTLLRCGVPYLSTMLRALELWMHERGYANLDAFRGKLSQKSVADPFAYERAQYVGLLQSRA